MRNKDYQTMSSFPLWNGGMSGKLGACCPSNNSIVSLRTINAQVVDEFGTPVKDVHVYPDGQESVITSTDANGFFILKNIPINSLINFSHQSIITQIPALRIEEVVEIQTIMELEAVEIEAKKKDKNLKYVGYGLLALLVLYGVSKMGKEKKTVKAKA